MIICDYFSFLFFDSNSFITTFPHEKYFIAFIILSSRLTLVGQVEMCFMFVLLDGGGGVCLPWFPRLLRLPLSRNACSLPSCDTYSLLLRLCLLSPPPVTSCALPSGQGSACLLRSPPQVMPALAPPVTPPLAFSGFSRNCGALPSGFTSAGSPTLDAYRRPLL